MDLLTNPQTSYLLQADLASLHKESHSWLSEIEFWEDELAFFYTLLHSKLLRQAYPTEEIASLDKRLVSINSDMLGAIKEQALNRTFSSVGDANNLVAGGKQLPRCSSTIACENDRCVCGH